MVEVIMTEKMISVEASWNLIAVLYKIVLLLVGISRHFHHIQNLNDVCSTCRVTDVCNYLGLLDTGKLSPIEH